jgi:AI-2 transport protein TqsA
MSKLADDAQRHWNVQTFCLLTLTLIAIGFSLYFLRPVLVPFVLAVFLTNCLIPMIDVQRYYLRLPKGLAIASTVTVTVAVVVLCGSLVASSVNGATSRLTEYESQFQHFSDNLARSVPLARFGIKVDTEQVGKFFSVQEGTGWQFITSVLGEAANVLSSGVIVIIFVLFLLLSGRGGRVDGQRPAGMLGEIESSVQKYVVTTVFLSLGTGFLVGLTLSVLGVELAWMFGFLAFLLNFVPSVGAIIATLLPVPVILLNPEMSITAKALAIIIPATIHFVIGSFVQPKVQGNALDLHPVVVMLALMFFGMIWGITGAFLATPITAVVRIVCARIPVTRPLADVLAGNLHVLSAEDHETTVAKRTGLA